MGSDADRPVGGGTGTLEAWAGATALERRRVERARIVLLAAAGLASRATARELGCRHHTVSK